MNHQQSSINNYEKQIAINKVKSQLYHNLLRIINLFYFSKNHSELEMSY